MPRGPHGLTHRQEKFCRGFVAYGTPRPAAVEAGYAPRWAVQHGHRLLRQPRIRDRIAELQAELARDSCRETDVMLGKLEAVYRRAMENHQFHAAVRAVEAQRRLTAQRRLAAPPDGPTALPADEPALTVQTPEKAEENGKMSRIA